MLSNHLSEPRVGRYSLIRKLATGGMAEVMLGKVVGVGGFEKPVAVKRMIPSLAADPSFVELFLREARLTVSLQHKNIVQIFDVGTARGQYYLVLEFIDGENLRSLLNGLAEQGAGVGLAEACYIVQQVAEGLAYAHNRIGPDGFPLNIIHRDINPTNVMISRTGEVKLTDFGIAKAADGTSRTEAGVIRGKAGYLSPEQVNGGELDQRSDLFLMGLFLHELLVGQRLFEGPNYFTALRAIVEFRPESLRRPTHVPEALWAIVLHLLQVKPEARLSKAEDLSEALQSFLFDARWRTSDKEIADVFARGFPGRASPLKDFGAAQPNAELQIELVGERAAGGPQPLVPSRPRTATGAAASPPVIRPQPASGMEYTAPGKDRAPARPATSPVASPPPAASAPAASKRRRLGEILVSRGKLTEAQLTKALDHQAKDHRRARLGDYLIAEGVVSDFEVIRAQAEQSSVPYVADDKLRALPIPGDLVALMKVEQAERLFVVPIARRGKALIVAMRDALDQDKLKAVKMLTGAAEVRGVYATEAGIRSTIGRFYRGEEPPPEVAAWTLTRSFEDIPMTPFADRVTGTREQLFDEERIAKADLPGKEAPEPAPPRPRTAVSRVEGPTPALAAVAGAVKKVLIVGDRADVLASATEMLLQAGLKATLSAPAEAEAAVNAESPDLIVVSEDGSLPVDPALLRRLSGRAELRSVCLAGALLGESNPAERVAQVYAQVMAALCNAGRFTLAPEVPLAAKLARTLAAKLGAGSLEQERACAAVFACATAATLGGKDAVSLPSANALRSVLGTSTVELADLVSMASEPRSKEKPRPYAASVVAILTFAERAGSLAPSPGEAAAVIDEIKSEERVPPAVLDMLLGCLYEGTAPDVGQPQVVLAESDPATAAALQSRLLASGFRVVRARDGGEARLFVERGSDALIASTTLADTTGAALAIAARAGKSRKRLAIFLIGAEDDTDSLSTGLDSGADDVMLRPVNPEVLIAKLRRVLAMPRSG